MLNNPGEQIRQCLQHAEECAREAAKLPNSSPFRQDFLQLVKHWLELAGSIEFGEQLDGFTQIAPSLITPTSKERNNAPIQLSLSGLRVGH